MTREERKAQRKTTGEELIRLAMEYCRLANPKMRRTEATAIVHSGGRQTVYRCVCGAEHTCATKYREAGHVYRFRAEHAVCIVRHAAKLLAQEGKE